MWQCIIQAYLYHGEEALHQFQSEIVTKTITFLTFGSCYSFRLILLMNYFYYIQSFDLHIYRCATYFTVTNQGRRYRASDLCHLCHVAAITGMARFCRRGRC